MAREETALFLLLWAAGIAIWNVYGGDDPEARIWTVVMFAQSLPYVASLVTAAINTLPHLKRRDDVADAVPVVSGE